MRLEARTLGFFLETCENFEWINLNGNWGFEGMRGVSRLKSLRVVTGLEFKVKIT